MKMVRTAAAVVPALALGLVLAQPPTASADEEACARQQTQVQRAEDALAHVTAVFDRQKTRVNRAERALQRAETRAKRAEAKAALAKARERLSATSKERKAQKVRLAKANQRLENCLAG